MNVTPFFVTGLPRSRSAWVANWLTTGNTICYHDVAYSMKAWIEGGGEALQTGFAGPETVMDFDKARKDFPDCPWLVVMRNTKEAFAAFKAWAGSDLPNDPRALRDFWEGRCEMMADLCTRPGVEVVNVHGLDNEDMARRIWSHLGINEPFRLERWKLLRTLNVQQDKKGARKWPLAR